jgi:hypothetical protein
MVNSKIENNKINNISSNEVNKIIWEKFINILKWIKLENPKIIMSYLDGKIDLSLISDKWEKSVFNIEKEKALKLIWTDKIWLDTVNWIWFIKCNNNFLVINLGSKPVTG